MIYYIEYSREQQQLLSIKPFAESDRSEAQAHALARELEWSSQGLPMEIVLLEADSEATIRNTHPRYFGDPFGADMREVWLNMPVHPKKLEPKIA